MKLRRKFFTFAFLIHAVLVLLSLLLLSQSKYLFVAAELLILVSLAVTIHLYKSFLKPLDILSAGVESIKDQDFSMTFVETGQVELDRLIDVYNRMIEQLRNERIRQREQHFFLERLVEATPIAVIILDLDEKVMMLNPAARDLLGVEADEVLGRSLTQFTEMPGAALGGMKAGETRIVNVSGMKTYKCRASHFLDRGFHRQFILIEEFTREILTAQKRAYEKVIRMMSHEINNSVGAVNSILHSALNYAPQLTAEDRQDFGHVVRVAIDRNNGLNKFMANFADVIRIPPPAKEHYDLHDVLRAVHLLMSTEGEKRNIAWVWDLSPSPFMVHIDVRQIEQVLVNIIKNAVEAIDSRGTITVRTTSAKPRMLRIIDDGPGFPPEKQSQLFTPFFSTKKNGQGIGLTLIREILVNHGFDFNLSATGAGRTEFWIKFDPTAVTTNR